MREDIIQEDIEFIRDSDMPWRLLEGKNILLSGASGFVASYIAEVILFLNKTFFAQRAKIFAIVRNIDKAKARFGRYTADDGIEFIEQDVCEPVEISDRIHFVIHAASHASPKYYGMDPVGTLSANSFGTKHLLDAARKNQSQSFLFISSSEIYGYSAQGRKPIKEDVCGRLSSTDVRSCYAESKRFGETACVSYFKQYGVPAKIVRLFHTYGPGMDLNDGRVFADFVADIVSGRNIAVKSRGRAVRCFCYIADAITAIFTVLLKGAPGEAYNAGNDKCAISISDLAALLAGLFPEKDLRVEKKKVSSGSGYMKSPFTRQIPDISKIRELGWDPKFLLEEGFRRTVRSFCHE